MTIQTLFALGMKRKIPELIRPAGQKLMVNLGCGKQELGCTINLDLPGWNGNKDPIPCDDESVQTIYAFHFLEHLDDPVTMLQECQRVLAPGGAINIIVPYGAGHLACQDLNHKCMFNEETWKNLFNNPYYNPTGGKGCEWQLHIGLNIIIGIVERNLCLMTQLIKTD